MHLKQFSGQKVIGSFEKRAPRPVKSGGAGGGGGTRVPPEFLEVKKHYN